MYVNGGGKFFLDILNKPKKWKRCILMLCTFTCSFFFKSDEWLQSYDLKCINMYNLDRGECTLANFLSFPTFLNCFRPMWLKITHSCKFGQKSGLDWVKMAKFSHFAGFSIFSPKMRLELTRNGQFYLIHNPNWNNIRPWLEEHVIFSHFYQLSSFGSLDWSSEVEHNL